MRLIDADRLKETFCREYKVKQGIICNIIDEAPTVDAVKIIMCKDCTKWQKHDCMMKYPQRCKENDGCTKGVPHGKEEKKLER